MLHEMYSPLKSACHLLVWTQSNSYRFHTVGEVGNGPDWYFAQRQIAPVLATGDPKGELKSSPDIYVSAAVAIRKKPLRPLE